MLELWSNGVPYAAGGTEEDRPAVEWFPAGTGEQTSAVVVCPGGGYQNRAGHEGKPIAEWLNSIGISAAVLRYRVAPYSQPVPLLDASRAVRFVRYHAKDWNVDPNRIGILGFSAGGHLACSAGIHADDGNPEAVDPIDRQSSRTSAMILCYPVITMGAFTHEGSKRNLMGEHPNEELINYYSMEKQVHDRTPPAFLWHTTDDGAVPVENVLQLAMAMRQKQIPFELHSFESGRHGLGLALDHPQANVWTSLCATWLRKQGFC